jgi:nicotinamidase/pyrazinamidase
MATGSVEIDRESAALLVVDMQPDFMPGGALAVAEGDRIVAPIAHLVESYRFRIIAATQDWHPGGHISFASSHPGRKPLDVIELYGYPQTLWPDHCVQGTPGAELCRDIPWNHVQVIIRKATESDCDSYSAFRNNWNARGERPPTGLGGYLRERGVREVFICGLARDFCVAWSAEDAVTAGFRAYVIWDLTRPVDPSTDDAVRDRLLRSGVVIVTAGELA